MTLDKNLKLTEVNLLIEKSDRNMEQAIYNANVNYWDLVSNRLYYSIFHAVNALLLLDGIKTGTHKGTSSQFGKYYVLTGVFDKQDGILYSRLQTMREKADYQNIYSLSREDGLKILEKASDLKERIIQVVKNKINQVS